MPIIRAENAPSFALADLAVVGLASPSRGSRETNAWRINLAAGAPGVPHSLDREEIFVALAGYAVASLGNERIEVRAGDALIIPSGQVFSLSNPGPSAFEAIAIAPVGVRAQMSNGDSFTPPWCV